MLKFEFAKRKDQTLKILCLGAHSDDIEIGCGGTILRILSESHDAEVHWVVLGSSGQRDGEATASANKFLDYAKEKHIIVKNFKDGFFPYVGGEIKSYFEELKQSIVPDLIFTPYRYDLHQDHRLTSELTWNTWRRHLILEYEIIKYDGDLGAPNFFVHLDEKICKQKIRLIKKCFKTQRKRDWFTDDAFYSILRIRGIESRAPENYAEGFYCRKVII